MHRFFVLFLGAFILIACNKEKEERDLLYKEVMDMHDKVMPEMGSLRSLSVKLQSQADSLLADSVAVDSVKLEKILFLKKQLEDASESMMQWMRDFEPLEEGTPHGEVIHYLMEQKKAIDKVRKDMINSKDEAEKYFLEK